MLKSKAPKILVSLFIILMFTAINSHAIDFSTIDKKMQEKTANIDDLKIAMDITMTGNKKEMTMETITMLKGEKFRSEAKVPAPEGMPGDLKEIKTVTLFDGENMWQITPIHGKKKMEQEKKEEHEKRTYSIYWWQFMEDEEVNYVKEEKVNERNCYHFKQTAEEGTIEMWIDKNNLAPVKIIDKTEEEPTTLVFSDFKKINEDWEIPYVTEVFKNDEKTVEMKIKSVDLNKGISDDMFDADKVKIEKFNMMEMMKKMQNR